MSAPCLVKTEPAKVSSAPVEASVVAARLPGDAVSVAVEQWTTLYRLSPAEAVILTLAARGETRMQIACLRGAAPSTIKKQVQMLLKSTRDGSLDAAAARLLRGIVDGRQVTSDVIGAMAET